MIGGSRRGRRLAESGDIRTRPMKDRVREAVFNLLGPGVKGSHAIDLFAGTGALGLEALSRGAERATFIERHYPTCRLIDRNATALGMDKSAEVVFGSAFHWSAQFAATSSIPLVVFCSPPFDFYVEKRAEMIELIARWIAIFPAGSQIVVEADQRFDFGSLVQPAAWDVREYPPAVVGIFG